MRVSASLSASRASISPQHPALGADQLPPSRQRMAAAEGGGNVENFNEQAVHQGGFGLVKAMQLLGMMMG